MTKPAGSPARGIDLDAPAQQRCVYQVALRRQIRHQDPPYLRVDADDVDRCAAGARCRERKFWAR